MRILQLAAAVMLLAPVHSRKLMGATRQKIDEVLHSWRFTKDRVAELEASPLASALSPQQLHLALGNNYTEMSLVAVNFQTNSSCYIRYWPSAGGSVQVATTAVSTYNAGMFGWDGSIFTGVMTGLTPKTSYTYSVSCNNGSTPLVSEPRNFTAAPIPGPTETTYIAVTADMGTIVPLGWEVADTIIEEHTLSGTPFDMVMIVGDLSYATVDPPNNEVEWTWDAFCIQNEPFTSTAPYQTTVGNHEHVPGNITNSSGTFEVEFASYTARYNMPTGGGGYQNFWYSYDFGNAHYTAACTECDYSTGSPQWLWVQNDLAQANARRDITPFLIFTVHRPILAVDADEYSSHIPGAPLSVAFEPLLFANKVDLVLQGHEHEYERTHAVFNGTVMGLPNANNSYVNPGGPIYVVQGSSGAMQEESYTEPIPDWSAVHMDNVYGFGRMTIIGGSQLNYVFVDTDGVVHDAFQIVKT